MNESSPDSSSLPVSNPPPNNLIVAGVWMLVLALFLFSCGACAGIAYLVVPLTARGFDNLPGNVIFGSLAGIGIFLGAALAWQGANIFRRREPRVAAKSFPPSIIFIILFLFAAIIGSIVLTLPGIATYAFPPWHLLAGAIPPIAFVAFAARRLKSNSHMRALVTALTWGALGASSLAIALEVLVGIAFLILIAIVLTLMPGGMAALDQLQSEILLSRGTLDPRVIQRLLTDPGILLAVIGFAAVIVPVLEESVKALVVAFIDPRRTTLADATLWGIAAGAGFALFEGVMNSSIDLNLWVVNILARVTATIIHVANGATMGRGWYAARVEGRWNRLLTAFLISVLLHAVWNGTAIALSALWADFGDRLGGPWESLIPAGLPIALCGLVLAICASSGLVWIIHTTRPALPTAS